MTITTKDIIDKHAACVSALDENKKCSTCKNINTENCGMCYNCLLGFPIDPTKWEAKE